MADAAKKNPENETEEVVVAEDVEEMDDLDDDDMDNAEPPANAANDATSDSLTEDKIGGPASIPRRICWTAFPRRS